MMRERERESATNDTCCDCELSHQRKQSLQLMIAKLKRTELLALPPIKTHDYNIFLGIFF